MDGAEGRVMRTHQPNPNMSAPVRKITQLTKPVLHLVTDVSLEHQCQRHQFHQGGNLRPDANAQMLGLVGSNDPSFREGDGKGLFKEAKSLITSCH